MFSFQSGQKLFQFVELLLFVFFRSKRLRYAGLQMGFQNVAFHGADGRAGCAQLDKNIWAVAQFFNHLLHALQLSDDSVQARNLLFVAGVPVFFVFHLGLAGLAICRSHTCGSRSLFRFPCSRSLCLRRTDGFRHRCSCRRRCSSGFCIWGCYRPFQISLLKLHTLTGYKGNIYRQGV